MTAVVISLTVERSRLNITWQGISQTQINQNRHDFAKGLRAILNKDPDVIMVGDSEIRG